VPPILNKQWDRHMIIVDREIMTAMGIPTIEVYVPSFIYENKARVVRALSFDSLKQIEDTFKELARKETLFIHSGSESNSQKAEFKSNGFILRCWYPSIDIEEVEPDNKLEPDTMLPTDYLIDINTKNARFRSINITEDHSGIDYNEKFYYSNGNTHMVELNIIDPINVYANINGYEMSFKVKEGVISGYYEESQN